MGYGMVRKGDYEKGKGEAQADLKRDRSFVRFRRM